MKPQTENWLRIAKYDLKSAQVSFDGEMYFKVIESCHSAIEKLLKGIITEQKDTQPPKVHDLLKLVSLTLIQNLQSDIQNTLDDLNDLFLSVRYPDNFDQLVNKVSKDKTADIFKKVKEIFKWLEKQIN